MEWMEEVQRCTSLAPLACPCFVLRLLGLETEGLLDYQGRGGDHFHCTVEPSPGCIRCWFLRPGASKEASTKSQTCLQTSVGGLFSTLFWPLFFFFPCFFAWTQGLEGHCGGCNRNPGFFLSLRVFFCSSRFCGVGSLLGARLRGRTATQRSKKGSEMALGRVLGKGSQKGSEQGACYGFYSKKDF